MKMLIASVAAAALMAAPAMAAPNSAASTTTTKVTPTSAKGKRHGRVKKHRHVTHKRVHKAAKKAKSPTTKS